MTRRSAVMPAGRVFGSQVEKGGTPVKKLILLTVIVGVAAGAFFAFRWFRGETAYDDAIDDLEPVDAAPA
jgi:hypothetical protein